MNKLLILIGLIFAANSAFSNDMMPSDNVISNKVQYDHVVWNGIPISFVVPVGQERILKFPSNVSLHNTNSNLTTDKVNILNNNGYLYINAKKAFDPIRIPFVIKRTGEVILIDLSSKQNTSDTPVSVLLQTDQENKNIENLNKEVPQSINFVTLTRYAIQNLYSPDRLVKQNSSIYRTPMYTSKSVNLFNNSSVVAMPLISWKGGDLYVTAILLKNIWNQKQVLDPRSLNGSWLSASFYPSNAVTVSGTKNDRTTIFLISNQPFNSALNQVKRYT